MDRTTPPDPSIEALDRAIAHAKAAPIAVKLPAVEQVITTARQVLVNFAERLARLEARQ